MARTALTTTAMLDFEEQVSHISQHQTPLLSSPHRIYLSSCILMKPVKQQTLCICCNF